MKKYTIDNCDVNLDENVNNLLEYDTYDDIEEKDETDDIVCSDGSDDDISKECQKNAVNLYDQLCMIQKK